MPSNAGETLRLDTECLVAISDTINYDVQFASDIKSSIFGGEGIFLATLTGPGHVWLQSLPFFVVDKGGRSNETNDINARFFVINNKKLKKSKINC